MITSLGAVEPATTTASAGVLSKEQPEAAAKARVMTPAEALAARKPPPPLDTPEAEEADVRRRANFRYPDDFEGGLEWFTVGRGAYGVTTVGDDALVLTGDPRHPGYPHWSDFRGALAVCEFVMEARIAKLEGADNTDFGFTFHAAPIEAYGFSLCGNGDVIIRKIHNYGWSELARVERCPRVNCGNAENMLKAVRRHGRLHMFVNGAHVLPAEDFDLAETFAECHLRLVGLNETRLAGRQEPRLE